MIGYGPHIDHIELGSSMNSERNLDPANVSPLHKIQFTYFLQFNHERHSDKNTSNVLSATARYWYNLNIYSTNILFYVAPIAY